MERTPLLLLNLGWAALAVGAFIAGPPTGRDDADRTDPQGAGEPASDRVIPRVAKETASEPALTKADGSFDSAGLVRAMSPTDIVDCLRSGLASNDPIERDLMISQALSQLTAANAPALLALLENSDWRSSSEFESAYERFMLAWGRVDGPSAVAYQQARTIGRLGFDMTENAIRGWSEIDPEAAVAYLNEAQLPPKKFDTYLSRIVEGVLATDRGRAYSLTANLEAGLMNKAIDAIGEALETDQESLLAWADHAANTPGLDSGYLEAVIYEIGTRTNDPRSVAEWMARNPSYPYDSFTTNWVVREWASTDPVAALEWVNGASDPRLNNRLSSVMESWTKSDTEAAKAWTMNNMDDPRLKDAIHHVVDGLANTDLPAAVDWVDQLDPELMSPAVVARLVEPWVKQAPADALRWADSVPDDDLQNSAIHIAASYWPEDRLDEFDSWLSTAGTGPDLDYTRFRLAFRIGEQNPTRALEIASTITDAEQRQGAMVKAARILMAKEPETVLRWLPESGLPDNAQLEVLGE